MIGFIGTALENLEMASNKTLRLLCLILFVIVSVASVRIPPSPSSAPTLSFLDAVLASEVARYRLEQTEEQSDLASGSDSDDDYGKDNEKKHSTLSSKDSSEDHDDESVNKMKEKKKKKLKSDYKEKNVEKKDDEEKEDEKKKEKKENEEKGDNEKGKEKDKKKEGKDRNEAEKKAKKDKKKDEEEPKENENKLEEQTTNESQAEVQNENKTDQTLNESKVKTLNGFGGADTNSLNILGAAVDLSHEDPEVKKVCDSTDYPLLCAGTVTPKLKGKASINDVLQASFEAGTAIAKEAKKLAKELKANPNTPLALKSAIKECQDSYGRTTDNFDNALAAAKEKDVGTMRSMLSASITFLGECQDKIIKVKGDSPLNIYATKLTEMVSNSLAIVTLLN